MAITVGTVTLKEARASQPNFVAWTSFDLDASYPAGGYPLGTVLAVKGVLPGHSIILVKVEPAYPYTFGWDRANNKLVVYVEDGVSGITAEVAAATNLSAVTDLIATIFTE